MKVQITVIDDKGKEFTGEIDLQLIKGNKEVKKAIRQKKQLVTHNITESDLNSGNRAFIKKFVKRKTPGPNKFVILLSWMVKGKTNINIKNDEIKKQWNRVKGLMGGKYQRMYATRAKENGWVDSNKKGLVHLVSNWKAAFN
jgi:hypothetical protein